MTPALSSVNISGKPGKRLETECKEKTTDEEDQCLLRIGPKSFLCHFKVCQATAMQPSSKWPKSTG